MPTLSAAQETALASRHVMRRLLLIVDGTGFWDDIGPISVAGQDYTGSGTLGEAFSTSGSAELKITPLVLQLSGISAEVANLIRGALVGQEDVTLAIGIFNPDTKTIIGPPIVMFKGQVDDVPIVTPPMGAVCTITLTCESIARELTIRSTDTRSDDSQQNRLAGDRFYKFTDKVRERTVYFGSRPKKHKNKRLRDIMDRFQ